MGIQKFSRKSRSLRKFGQAVAQAESYEEWLALAEAYDRETGADEWRRNDGSRQYDHASISKRLKRLRTLRKKGDDHGLLFALNEGIHGNMAGMGEWRSTSEPKPAPRC